MRYILLKLRGKRRGESRFNIDVSLSVPFLILCICTLRRVIAAALACEYCGQTGVDHSSLLHGFSSRLRNYPCMCSSLHWFNLFIIVVTVADACLLSMTRIVADCEIIPPEVLESVQVFGQSSRQYIRRV